MLHLEPVANEVHLPVEDLSSPELDFHEILNSGMEPQPTDIHLEPRCGDDPWNS